jgi:uncharacterized RDD family membrane protein YckC
MKCPKCGYLAFESGERCRNCGYDFSLTADAPAAFDVLLDPSQTGDGWGSDTPSLKPALDLDRMIGVPDDASVPDLPLFERAGRAAAEPSLTLADEPPVTRGHRRGDENLPMISAPSKPRAPLGVRRSTPEIPRARIRTPRTPESTLFETPQSADRRSSEASLPATTRETLATPASRVMAALLDMALLTSLDTAVLYFTLRLLGLSSSEILDLPAIPLAAFFLLLNGGYFTAFTAVGGQSIGKMAFGIKVIAQEEGGVPVGRATLRTFAYLISALPLGAGFLPGIFGGERLALHDRLAHTRVVRPTST